MNANTEMQRLCEELQEANIHKNEVEWELSAAFQAFTSTCNMLKGSAAMADAQKTLNQKADLYREAAENVLRAQGRIDFFKKHGV